MRRISVIILTMLAIVVPATAAGAAPASKHFVSPLSGREEVPAVATGATGNGVYRLNSDESAIDYRLTVANIEDVTQAHIHCGTRGSNGPVVAFLFGPDPGVTTSGILAEGTITAESVIPRPSSASCPGGVSDLEDVVAKMRSGGAYANVHTVQNPGGEIRGQIRETGAS